MLRFLSRRFSGVLRLVNTLFSGKVLAVRAICLDGKGRIFLVRHTYTPGWHLPGGGVANGLSAVEALAREIREEGNLAMCGAPVLRQIYINRTASKREHIVLYSVKVAQTELKQPSLEIAEAGFFAMGALPENVDPATLRRIGELAAGRFAADW